MTPAPDIAEAIRAHARENPAAEVCGLVFASPGKKASVVRPCANVHADPRNHFAIGVEEYERAEREAGGSALMVYHSHPFTGPELSVADKEWSNANGIPYLLYCLGTDSFALHEPTESKLEYEGRPFCWGILDCWALARDWFKREKTLDLPNPARGPLFWQHSDLFVNHLEAQGWAPVPFGQWKRGDLLLFAINTEGQNPDAKANHCAVLLEDDGSLILHHVEGRKSRIEPFNSHRAPWFPHLYRYPTQSAWRAPATA